jgi:Fibronectin type III domain.
MAISISGSSSQSENQPANQSTVTARGTMVLTVGNWFGLQSWGRVNIDGAGYSIPGPTSMNQGGSWSWDASRIYGHDFNTGTRGAVSSSVSHDIDGTTLHRGSAGAGTVGALDYNRSALQASAPSVSRSSNGQTLFYSGTDPGAYNNGTQRDFSWQYRAAGGGYLGLGDTGEPTGSSVSVNQHTTYYVRVLAYNGDGNNGWSADSAASFGIPNSPANPSATRSASTAGRIDLSWSAPSYVGGGITKYQVYRGATLVRDSGTGTTFSDTGLVRGTTYNYTIYGVNSTGVGTVSSTVSAMAPGVPSEPGVPTVVSKNWKKFNFKLNQRLIKLWK